MLAGFPWRAELLTTGKTLETRLSARQKHFLLVYDVQNSPEANLVRPKWL